MTKLQWNLPQDQIFEAGLDRGVIYTDDGRVASWNGLSSVEDGGESTTREFYVDGIKFLSTVSPRDWRGKLVAYTYPDLFSEMIGIGELGDGLYVDSQAPDRFNLSYRTMVTAPSVDNDQHYKIHLIYKVMASLNGFTNATLNGESTDPTAFEFDLSSVPIRIPNMRPSSHIILDTRKIDSETLEELEGILYGTDSDSPRMPTVAELVDLLFYGSDVEVYVNPDGSWTARGSNANVRAPDSKGRFKIKNVNAVYRDSDVYVFPDAIQEGEEPNFVVLFDVDGTPYVSETSGASNLGQDADGAPYVGEGLNELQIKIDTDDVPYFE